MRWWLTLVARQKSDELFMLNLLLITLGLAWLTEHAGLSLALGAFVAGMLISETEFKHQVETDIRPFHDVLLGLFLHHHRHDARLAPGARPLAAGAAAAHAPAAFKLALITGLARALGASMGTFHCASASTLPRPASSAGAADARRPAQPRPAATVQPDSGGDGAVHAGHALHDHVHQRHRDPAGGSDWLMQAVQMTRIASQSDGQNVDQHVIICGYGRCGQNLARLLEGQHPLHGARSRPRPGAAGRRRRAFGGVWRRRPRLQALVAAGLHRASAVVVTYVDTASALKVLAPHPRPGAQSAGGGAHG
jgi:CPA2 family monovalent cation:H+ antiporter-2